MSTDSTLSTEVLLDAFLLSRRIGWHRGRPASAKTLRRYSWSLPPFLAACPSLTAQEVYAYLDRARERFGEGSWSYYGVVKDVRAFLRWAHEEGHIAQRPRIAKPAEPDTLPRHYSREEVQAILRAVDRHTWVGRRDYVLLHLLWDCGPRAAEVCRLRREDVNVTGGRWVRLFGKGRKERFVGLSQKTAHLLRQWMREHPAQPSDYLFPSVKGGHLTPNGLWELARRYCRAAGVQVPRAVHAWRHTFAVHSYERGADISDLKDDLGHTTYRTVDIYRRIAAPVRQTRHDRYSPVEEE